jgi:hypothetical protein
VFQRYILWCALLLCRYCVYPSLNISRSSLHIFCELDCLLREISLNLLIPVRPVWYTDQIGLDLLITFKVCKFQVLPIHPHSKQLLGVMIEEIRSASNMLPQYRVMNARHEANKIAHELAKRGLLKHASVWSCDSACQTIFRSQ